MAAEKIQPNLEKIPVSSQENLSPKNPEKKENQTEKNAEQQAERKIEDVIKQKVASLQTDNTNDIVATSHQKAQLEERKKQIDQILSEGLEDIYIKLPRQKQMEFKNEGEKAVTEINKILSQTKVKVKKIINIIKDWLAIIPGVNKFFLEQEAKIKSDKIMNLKNNN